MPQRDLLLPWLSALDNAGLALRAQGRSRAEARDDGGAVARALRACGVRAHPSGRALRRHAPARVVPALAAGRQAGAGAGRAVRGARRDHAPADAGVARPRARARAAHGGAGHPRRRGGGHAGRPRGRDVAAPRPRASPRSRSSCRGRATAPTPRWSALREQALRRRWGCRREAALLRSLVGGSALLLLAALLGVWELYVDLGRRRSADPARPPRGRERALQRPLAPVVELPGHSRGGAARDPARGRGRIRAARSRSISRDTLRRAVYPLLVASQTIPIPMIAPVLVLWLGFSILPEAGRDRARVVLPDRGHDAGGARRRRAWADQADAHVRRLARCAPSATSSCPRRCPAC